MQPRDSCGLLSSRSLLCSCGWCGNAQRRGVKPARPNRVAWDGCASSRYRQPFLRSPEPAISPGATRRPPLRPPRRAGRFETLNLVTFMVPNGLCGWQVPDERAPHIMLLACMIGIMPTNGSAVGVPGSASGSASERKRPLVPEVRSPTLRRRELGVRLRAMRLDHGLTVEQVADQMLCSPSKVSRMETGQRGATPRDVRDLCRIYGLTDAAEVQRLMELAREGKQQAWWQPYELDYFATYVDLEQAATTMSYYHTTVVPGLLQTVEYAKSMFAWTLPTADAPAVVDEPAVARVGGTPGVARVGGAPGRHDHVIDFAPERRDRLIDVRLRRQQVLTREPPPQLEMVFDEAVLHRVVGGPKVMAAQLCRLTEASSMPNVTLRVIPFSAGSHPAMDNIFTVLDFADAVPSVVYVEGLMGWLYLERENEVARYKQVLERLRSIALPPRETVALISEVGARYTGAA